MSQSTTWTVSGLSFDLLKQGYSKQPPANCHYSGLKIVKMFLLFCDSNFARSIHLAHDFCL
jgi:hypothetical protein